MVREHAWKLVGARGASFITYETLEGAVAAAREQNGGDIFRFVGSAGQLFCRVGRDGAIDYNDKFDRDKSVIGQRVAE